MIEKLFAGSAILITLAMLATNLSCEKSPRYEYHGDGVLGVWLDNQNGEMKFVVPPQKISYPIQDSLYYAVIGKMRK